MNGYWNEWMDGWRSQAIRRLIITLLSDEARRQWTVLDRAGPDWVAVYPCTNSASPPCRTTRWRGFSACYPGSWKTLRGPQDLSWWAGLLENQSRFRTRSPNWGLSSSDSVDVTPYTVFQTLYHTLYHTLCFKHCIIHCIIHCVSNTVPYTVSYIVSNTASFNVFNNCVKHQPILTVFGMWHPEETLHDIG